MDGDPVRILDQRLITQPQSEGAGEKFRHNTQITSLLLTEIWDNNSKRLGHVGFRGTREHRNEVREKLTELGVHPHWHNLKGTNGEEREQVAESLRILTHSLPRVAQFLATPIPPEDGLQETQQQWRRQLLSTRTTAEQSMQNFMEQVRYDLPPRMEADLPPDGEGTERSEGAINGDLLYKIDEANKRINTTVSQIGQHQQDLKVNNQLFEGLAKAIFTRST